MNFPEVEINSEGLKKILDMKWLGMQTITHIDIEDAVKKGENYGSIMKRLKITGENAKGETLRKNIVMKKYRVIPGDTEFSIFKGEIQVYTKILPKFKEIIDESGQQKNLNVWPVCCGVRNYDIILLEDLVAAGYNMRNRRIPLPSDVAIFCAENLGKFHGLSVTAIRRKMIDPNTLTSNRYASGMPVLMDILSGGLTTLADSINNDPQWKSVVPNLRTRAKNISKELASLAEKFKGVFPVINHGDCWTNNMLFKYDQDTGSPSSMMFVDYQVLHYSCFAWDLTSIMHSSMNAQTRQSCYKKMMENYRNSLVQTLQSLNEDVSEVPDIDRMLQIMNEFAPFALVVAFSYFPLTINTLEKPWEFEKANSNESSNVHSPEMYENEIFKESFKLDVEKFKSQGLL